MGSKETRRMYTRTYIDRPVIVALLAQPPGVDELCVCVCNDNYFLLLFLVADPDLDLNTLDESSFYLLTE
jgi:hypothetical protein